MKNIIFCQIAALTLTVCSATNITYSSKGSNVTYPVSINGINLLQASAHDLSQALASKRITTLEIVDAYVARIQANDREGLNLRSLLEIAPSAREVAKKLDRERAKGNLRSSLHGIPIVVKDNYNTHPELGMNTTAGSYTLLGQTTKGDAFVVSKLREAGLLILGKANLNEFSGVVGRRNASAWSPRGGRISSAYVPGGFAAGGDPSGSSGGSAVSVSAGFATVSLGSDTEGSIIVPAQRAALFGLRPSTGITSRTGVVPISSTDDTTGPMGKSTWDIASILEIMAVHDPEDPFSLAAEPFRQKNYTRYLVEDGFRGLRIGIPREPFYNSTYTGARTPINAAIEKAMIEMQELGATIVETPLSHPEDFTYLFTGQPKRVNNATILVHYDLKADMAHYLQTQLVNSTITTLEDVINEMDILHDLEFPAEVCCQATFIAADQTGDRASSGEYWLARSEIERLDREELDATMRLHDLDLFLVPTEGGAARIAVTGRRPVGTVPLGYDEINLPFGMAFVGKRYDEPTVLRAMYAFEQAFPKRLVPPTLD